jgi:MFS family permease
MNIKKKLFNPLISVDNPRQIWFVLLAICLVNFMFNFYIGLSSVTLPTITEYYGASVTTATWISNIYLLTLTISVIFLGRIGGLWSRKKFFILGTLIWVSASLLCYYSTSTDTLILFRANFMIGFERIFFFAAVLSVLLMISTFDLEKYFKNFNFSIFIKRLKFSNKPKMPRKQIQSK